MFLVDEFGGAGFHITHQIRKRNVRFDADQQVQMVRHIVYGDQLLLLTGDNARDVFLKFFVMLRLNEVLPAGDGEHDVDVDLRVGAPATNLADGP